MQFWSYKPVKPAADDFDEHDEASGVISNLKLIQTPYNDNIEGNILRIQAFNIASLDENMQVIEVHRV